MALAHTGASTVSQPTASVAQSRRFPIAIDGFQTGRTLLVSLLIALFLVFAIESISRSSMIAAGHYLLDATKPGWTTVGLFFLLIVALDALLGRTHKAALLLGPLALIPAFMSQQKQLYLSDPLYPTDFLFGRQLMELMPVLVKDRPWTAVFIVLTLIAAIACLIWTLRFAWRNFPKMSYRQRALRLLLTVPLLATFFSLMDYNQFSWARDRLQIIPMMYDQKENYTHNGFVLAFAFNLPMATVAAPSGYSADAIGRIDEGPVAPVTFFEDKPDVIMVMSESFWDPTRLPNIKFSADPMPTVRKQQSGTMFSPEFGGMTANVEFEALTGFSNAFLPYGSIPYQQYVRRSVPSLATFFKGEGYETAAIHPFGGWFWNRNSVYSAFGFDKFLSADDMPQIEKRGTFASDAGLMREIMQTADASNGPVFYFAVTLQGHGPYEANRYPDSKMTVDAAIPDADKATLASYAQGIKDADDGLKTLMRWAKKRDRETILVFFGDHLPPLGNPYVSTGFMNDPTAERKGPLAQMKVQHETPLVVWSSRTGAQNIGTTSPAFLPYHILKLANFQHPFYTEYLGKVHEKISVIDRYMLVGRDETVTTDWTRAKTVDPLIRDYRYLQYDAMFGKQAGLERFFPSHADMMRSGS